MTNMMRTTSEYLLTDDEDDKDYNDHRSPLADDDDYNDSDQEQG